MKIAIHKVKGSYSDGWISYCERTGVDYKVVDCYQDDIIQQLSDCDILMWHTSHKSPKDSKFAKQLLFSVEASGKKVFPDFNTMWHFDDKVGQKYLLEALNLPMVTSYVFYDKKEAIEWTNYTTFPKVFKLRSGAGSDNVRLINSRRNCIRIIRKAFRTGFHQYNAWSNLKERYRMFRIGKSSLWDVLKGIIRFFYTTEYSRVTGREIGYVYFQDFIPDNSYDIRVVVIGDRAVALKRMVRENDFRASGSGHILYDRELFEESTIKLSFYIAERLKSQCVAFDFVHLDDKPLIVEISYGVAPRGYDPCPGYWDKDINWHEGKADLYSWMLEDIIRADNN